MAEYLRGRIWWISYAGPDGRIVQESTRQADRRVAQRLFRERKRQVASGTWRDPRDGAAGVTLADFAERWIVRQHDRGLRTAKDIEQRCRAYVLPALGEMDITEIRPRQVIEFVEGLKQRMRAGEIAPRSVHHVYDVLKWMFRDAVIDELVIATPCVLPPGTLPPKKDKDPSWRAKAVFTRTEVEALISDERIPVDRRTFYALQLLTGCRFGEAAGRRWSDYDPACKPLGRLVVDSQYEGRALKSPRGDAPPRAVPVHRDPSATPG